MTVKSDNATRVRQRCVFVFLACLLCLHSSALAQKFVVDPKHPQASDRNPGTAAQPFSTLGRALKELSPGETVAFILDGKSYELQIVPHSSSLGVGPDGSPRVGPKPAGDGDQKPVKSFLEDRDYLGYLIVMVIMALPLLLYFLWYQPRRKRRPLIEALFIIERDDRPNFPRAEELLNEALIAGLRARDTATTRFALAYVRTRLGQYPEAAAVLSDLMATGNRDQETIYLALWLHARQKQHDKVEKLFDEYAEALGELLDTKLIAGITFLHQGRLLWSRRQVSGALHYYERLRELEVLQDQIPSHIADHQVMFGIIALFEKDLEEARKHFTGAVELATKEQRPTTAGELGLLLCRWRAEGHPDIDEDLEKIAAVLEKDERIVIACDSCDREHQVNLSEVGTTLDCQGCQNKIVISGRQSRLFIDKGEATDADDAESDSEEPPELSEEHLLLRNVLLWHAVSLLYAWQGLPPKNGLPAAEKEHLNRRLDKVIAVDGHMSDPQLLGGLIAYYFAANETERQNAINILETAQQQGVNLPEVLILLQRERRLAELQRHALERFLVLVKNYLGDPGVPEDLRQELQERLGRFARFKDLGEIDMMEGDHHTAPSLKDIQARGTILRKRVFNIVKPKLTEAGEADAKALEDLLKSLEQETKSLAENTDRLEKTEVNLMATTGEFLFREEEEGVEDLPETASAQ